MKAKIIVDELAKSIQSLNEEDIESVIKKIQCHKRIFVYGMGRSGLMLKALAMRLMQIGLQAFVVGETTTPSVEKGDLLIVASASGETDSVNMITKSALKQGVSVVVLSSCPESTLGKLQHPDIIIESATKFATSSVSIQPLGSLFEQMLLIVFDTIILIMSQQEKGANDAMASRHASLE